MGRRRFTKTLAGLGLSRGVVEYISQDELGELTGDPTERVPRLQRFTHTNHEAVEAGAAPERKPVFTTIPREKWVRVESAWDAALRVDAMLDGLPGASGFSVGMRQTTGRNRRYVVTVDYPPGADVTYEELVDFLPDSVDGQAGAGENAEVVEDIQVVVETTTEEPTDYYDYEYRPVPGGCEMDSENTPSCTICTPAHDDSLGVDVLVTAGHCVDFSSSVDVYQPTDDDLTTHVGVSDKAGDYYSGCGNLDFDAATMTLDDEDDVKYALANDGGPNDYGRPIHGSVAWDTVKDWTDCDPKVFHQGKTSGNNKTCVSNTYTDQTFSWAFDSQKGDSGGPVYQEYHTPDGIAAYIAGIINCQKCYSSTGDCFGRGTYIGKVEDRFSLTV